MYKLLNTFVQNSLTDGWRSSWQYSLKRLWADTKELWTRDGQLHAGRLIVTPYTGRSRVWECGRSFWQGVWSSWLRECPGWRDVCHPPSRPCFVSQIHPWKCRPQQYGVELHNVTIRGRAWTIGAAFWLVTGSVDHNAASDRTKVNRGNASLSLRLSSGIGSGIVV